MKIAKKVLAIAIAVGMIFCLTAMAFAAAPAGAGVSLKVGEIEDGYVSVEVGVTKAIGTGAVTLNFEYDAAALEYDSNEDGDDAVQLKNCKSDENKNNIAAVNGTEAGKITFGYAFAGGLLSAADYAADAARGKTVDVNSDDFTLVVLWFKVADANKATTLSVSGTLDSVSVSNTATIGKEAAPETTTEATTEAPTTAAVTTTEAPTTAAVTTTKPAGTPAAGTANTGDNAALAVAGAVCALAAAAFVVTKKH